MELRRAKLEDIPAILDVQAANFIGNLKDAERRDGFLSVKFTRQQLEEMTGDVGIIIAAIEGRLVGYLCASSCKLNRPFPLLAAMMQRFDAIDHHGRSLASSRVFIYGPVCIDRAYRGRGLLRGLYETLQREVAGRYDIGVAFVAEDNPHSLHVHVDGFGMAHVGEFVLSGKQYHILAFDVRSEDGNVAASKPSAEDA
ncbi:MAG: GNAT family N-acetyltransferase [Nitrospira sp.]|nr:GNAT family N-acetyltransferase [Nitrospira sp.]